MFFLRYSTPTIEMLFLRCSTPRASKKEHLNLTLTEVPTECNLCPLDLSNRIFMGTIAIPSAWLSSVSVGHRPCFCPSSLYSDTIHAGVPGFVWWIFTPALDALWRTRPRRPHLENMSVCARHALPRALYVRLHSCFGTLCPELTISNCVRMGKEKNKCFQPPRCFPWAGDVGSNKMESSQIIRCFRQLKSSMVRFMAW